MMTAAVDSLTFRSTFATLATGVTVVSALGPDGPVGMIANSVVSVSLEPPLLGLFAARTSKSWPGIRSSGRFCVSVLAAGQAQLCRDLARPATTRFDGVKLIERQCGPGVADALAWIDCALETEQSTGDHFAIIARVLGMNVSADSRDPLIFFRGGYGTYCEHQWSPQQDSNLRPTT